MARFIPMTPGTGPGPRPHPSPLQVADYPGYSLGMFPDLPKFEIPDGGCFYLQDAILDKPNIARQRGGFVPMSNSSAQFTGGTVVYNPAGAAFLAFVGGGSSLGPPPTIVFSPLDGSALSALTLGSINHTARYVLCSPAVGGGSFIGDADGWDVGSTQELWFWKGGNKQDYTTGTISVTLGSTSVTGVGTTWTGNVAPGMFLLRNGWPVGTVASVNSDTSITLERPALQGLSGTTYRLTSLRGFWPMVAVGEVTCSTGSTTVTGSNTKFLKQGLNTGTWNLYRQRDLLFIGTVSSVTNDTSLTLTANAFSNCSVDNYLAIRSDVNWALAQNSTYGWITANYAGRQFYANQAAVSSAVPSAPGTVWFSAENIPEAIDTSTEDGDFIPVSSGSARSAKAPIKGMAAGFRSLLILKDDEAFALTGTSPEQFQVDKVFNDGTLSGHSVQTWQDNVIWAGRNGIYVWDGTTVTNLLKDNMRREYQKGIKGITNTVIVNSALVRDHYMLYISSVTPSYGPAKGGTPAIPSSWTIVINLQTGALNLWTNFAILCSVQIPLGATSNNTTTYVTCQNGANSALIAGDTIFDNVGSVDQFGSGPNFYVESKRYSLGAPVRRKLLKQIAMHYKAVGSGLTIDTMVGIDQDTSTTNTTSFPVTTGWDKKRYKFLKHDNFIAYRLYPTGTATEVQLGPFEFGFKTQAPGRI